MIWLWLGRLSALVVCGVVAGPVWADPYLRVAHDAALPQAGDAELETITVDPSRKAPRNIFDETYVSWCGDYVADDPTLFTRCRYGDARTVVARANYQW